MDKKRQRLDRQFWLLERRVPRWAARLLEWLRRPAARLVRIPLGLLLVMGGVLSFLPVLGIWMLPLGIFLLAVDLPFLRGPVGQVAVRGRRWWTGRKRRQAMKKRPGEDNGEQ